MPFEAEDLADAHEVAVICGLTNHRGVSTYRARYPDFPAPVIVKSNGQCTLWLRADVEKWARARK